MVENVFSIINFIWILFILGFLIYFVYLSFSTKNITKLSKELNYYEKYLERNGFNRCKLDKEVLELNKDSVDEQTKEKILEEYKNLDYKELELCTDFINKNPKNLYAIERRAALYSMTEKYDEAINDYSYLMNKEPKNFSHVKNCARMYAYINNLDTALSLINNFYRNKKHDAQYYAALGHVFDIVKDYDLSIKNYSQAIKMEPNVNELYYYDRASVYKEIGDEDRYQRDMIKYRAISSISVSERTNKQKNTSGPKPFYKNPLICKLAVIFIVSFAILYFHPTKEVMYCNQNQICNVERTYFGAFKINKEIKLKPSSQMTCSINVYARGKRHTNYGLYLRFDGIAPFVFYVEDEDSSYAQEELNRACYSYQQDFQQYLNNHGKYRYTIESKAGMSKLFFSLLIIVLLIIFLFIDDTNKAGKK